MNIEELIRNHKTIKTLPKMSPYMRDWASWYKGNVRNFHNYRIFNGTDYIDIHMKSMQMGKFACEKWADLLLNEKCKLLVKDSDQSNLDLILNNNNFWYRANNSLEKAFAIGMAGWYVSIDGLIQGDKGTVIKDNAKIGLHFVDAFKVQPITISYGEITECAFTANDGDYEIAIIHLLENGTYKIHSYKMFEGDVVDYLEFDTKSKIPYFFIPRPNIANNLNDEFTLEEMGMSILANSLDALKDLDAKYDAFYNEGVLKRPRIFLTKEAYQVDIESGEKIKSFDPRAVEFYYNIKNDAGEEKIQTTGDNLRFTEMIEGINAQLNYASMKWGFGQKFLTFEATGEVTATQVISENSTLYRSIKKHELLLENILRNLVKVIIQASNEFTSTQFTTTEKEIVIQFDDSIIEDKGAEKEGDKSEVAAGLMSREEYRIKWYGEDEDTAIENVRKYFLNEIINDYLPALTQGGMTPEQYVIKVYGDIDNKEEVIDYITKFINQGSINDFDPEMGTDGETDEIEEE